MGMLEDVIGSVIGGQQRGGGLQGGGQQGGLPGGLGGMLGGGGQGGMSPIAMALMALLRQQMSGGGGGGLGDLLGGLTGQGGGMSQTGGPGRIRQPDPDERAPAGSGYAANAGLEGMLERLDQAGHGQKTRSWVGDGDNQPIAPDELQQALGDDTVDRLSTQSGLPKDDLLSQLSQVLPGVIDKLTPKGRLPSREEASNW